jgi:hypothetical protein
MLIDYTAIAFGVGDTKSCIIRFRVLSLIGFGKDERVAWRPMSTFKGEGLQKWESHCGLEV